MAINIDNEMFSKIRQEVSLYDKLAPVAEKIVKRVNLRTSDDVVYGETGLNNNIVIRVCLLTGLSQTCERTKDALNKIELSPNHLHQSLFMTNNMLVFIHL